MAAKCSDWGIVGRGQGGDRRYQLDKKPVVLGSCRSRRVARLLLLKAKNALSSLNLLEQRICDIELGAAPICRRRY